MSKSKLEKEIAKWAKKVKHLQDAARASERITEKDLRIVINARAGEDYTKKRKRRQ